MGRAATPVADHLFNIRDKKETRSLEEERALAFHRTVAQLLFMLTRARRDIQTAVAFLTTRVKNPSRRQLGEVDTSSEISEQDKVFEVEVEY
jgi:hypothetical protein